MKQPSHSRVPDARAGSGHAGRFVERMLSGFGHVAEPARVQVHPPPTQPYRPLPQLTARAGATYRLQTHATALRVQPDSPATDVMTDLSGVAAVVTHGTATVEAARQAMIAHGVRALFVLDEEGTVLGIITATDVLGEKPIRVAQQRRVGHAEVLVRDVMTPASLLETMELDEVLRARVGDIVASLRRSGRQHALVVAAAPADTASPTLIVRGIFSLTQIARQLGHPPQSGHSVARTFAEIEAAIGA